MDKHASGVSIEDPVFLLGMPRSGTTWLSQILESSPDFEVRLSPNYSYVLKNRLDMGSPRADWLEVLRAATYSDNAFLTQDWRRDTGDLPRFDHPRAAQRRLAIKDTRFHHLYMHGMELFPQAQCIALIRHPCGALASWRDSKEFPAGVRFEAEWRSGETRKREGPGEYWGFDDWVGVTRLFLAAEAREPGRVLAVRYEDLARDPMKTTETILGFLGSRLTSTTRGFIESSQSRHDPSPYSVFKSPETADAWRASFPPPIRKQIEDELRGTSLERFLA
jgi:hypothetical protein